MAFFGIFEDKKDKSVEAYLAEATKHAQGNTPTETTGSFLLGGFYTAATAAVGYVFHLGHRKFKDTLDFARRAKAEGLDIGSTIRAQQGKEFAQKHFDKLYTQAYRDFDPTMPRATSQTLSTIVRDPLKESIFEPTELGKSFEKARTSWQRWDTKFSKETIQNTFKEHNVVSKTIIGIAAAVGIYEGYNAYRSFQQRHDQKVADNFKKAMRQDNRDITQAVKEATTHGEALTVDKARDIAAHRAKKSYELFPDSTEEHSKKSVVGKHTAHLHTHHESAERTV